MALIIFFAVYITLLCYGWGTLILRGLYRSINPDDDRKIHFGIICTLGLATITTIATAVSLAFPLGIWPVQLLFSIPPLLLVKKIYPNPCNWVKSIQRNKTNFTYWLLPFCCSLLIIVLNTAYIQHEDTLWYHAQIIQWIEKYKVTPGIVHLHQRYGLQSSWFISCALFSFDFLHSNALTFINSTVLIWYVFFITTQIRNNIHKNAPGSGLCLLIFLLFNFWNFNQIRLSATSANPDFIVSALIWLILFLCLTHEIQKSIKATLIIILSAFLITIKLSSAPIIIILVYAIACLIKKKQFKLLAICLLFTAILFGSFITRNVVTSGYPLFPTTIGNFSNEEWELDKKSNFLIQDYITAYARVKSGFDEEDIRKAIRMNFSEWGPIWWSNQSFADKTIMITVCAFIILLFIKIKEIKQSGLPFKIALVTCLAGIAFWFIKAPDPRFGFGFIMGLFITVFYILKDSSSLRASLFTSTFFAGVMLFASAIIILYTGYRLNYFFDVSQIWAPKGIKPAVSKTINCNNISVEVAESAYACGSISIPCAYDSCKTFQPRGLKIEDGFKAR